ncbi:MAG: DNA sulfur modification protein DndB [Actinomycetota bacterium]|mgnify:CR=1 FL=1
MSTQPPSADALDLDAGTFIQGLPSGEGKFLATTNFKKLMRVMRNPRDLQPTARRVGAEALQLEDEASIHELIQRALAGSKKANVARYADYIEGVTLQDNVGVLPPMHLWSIEALEIVPQPNGRQYVLIPDDVRLLAIDGETQLTAHFELYSRLSAEEKKRHGEFPLDAVIHHGIDVQAAQQYFHDLNVLAVRPSTSLGLAMDSHDPLMKVVGILETRIPYLTGRVDKQARQLRKNSTKVITVQTLRQMVINVARGVAGVQYGARPAPLDGIDMDDVTRVAHDWFSAYFNEFSAQVIDREGSLAGTPAVLAAVGAMGNQLLAIPSEDREVARGRLLSSLRTVNWSKDHHWSGIAGTVQLAGGFKVGGTKEVAYSIFNVLTDEANPGYKRIRTVGSQAYLADEHATPLVAAEAF